MFLWKCKSISLGFVNFVPLQLLNYSFHTVAVIYILTSPSWIMSFTIFIINNGSWPVLSFRNSSACIKAEAEGNNMCFYPCEKIMVTFSLSSCKAILSGKSLHSRFTKKNILNHFKHTQRHILESVSDPVALWTPNPLPTHQSSFLSVAIGHRECQCHNHRAAEHMQYQKETDGELWRCLVVCDCLSSIQVIQS